MRKFHPAVVLFFTVFLILGIRIVPQYGVSTDEWNNRLNGAVSFKYVYGILSPEKAASDPVLKDIPSLHEFYDRDYGVVFDLPLFAVEWLFGLTGTSASVYLRHYFIFLLFFAATVFFYRLLFSRFKSVWLSLTGVFFLVLSPRIFAHAFFNIKDLAFLSIFLIGFYYLYQFFLSPSRRSAVVFGLVAAAAINCRILGVILPFVAVLWYFQQWREASFSRLFFKSSLFRHGLVVLGVMALVTYIIWPFLWNSPIINFLKAFKHMARFRWGGEVKYFGEWVNSTKIPWHYIPVWMAMTIPVLYSIFFVFGTVRVIKDAIRDKFKLNKEGSFLDRLILFVFLFPIVTVIILHSVMYGDWRHMYFIYPFFVYLAVVGLETTLGFFSNSRAAQVIIAVVLAVNFTWVANWMIRNHPHQHLYFSFLDPQKALKGFDMDYWTLTNRPAYEYILRNQKDSCYIVSTKYDNLFQCSQFLDRPTDTSKYKLVLFKYVDKMTDSVIDELRQRRPTYVLDRSAFQLPDSSRFRLQEIHSVIVEGNRLTSVSTFALK
jgi:hypothetical protein